MVHALFEDREGESRVALTPETAKRFAKAGLTVRVERGAGAAAGFPDADYEGAGVEVVSRDAIGEADLVLTVGPPSAERVGALREGAVLLSFVQAARNPELAQALAARGVSTLAMELVPRITRAQSMDALSSQATVAGYKAVLLGAVEMPKMCPLLMTAAGTVPPARVVVFGAGVAGLQAIATARRLGCVVEATDVRMAAKEQVESLGGRFITVPGAEDLEDEGGYAKEQSAEFLARQREEVAKRVAEADLVITTAQVPGRKAPVLVTADMVRSMQPGSVIVDMAVESGGNCELAELGEIVQREGVTIVGIANIPATVPRHASELYAKNVLNLAQLLIGEEGKLTLDREDEVIAGCLLTHGGEITHERTRELLANASGGKA
ncbi:MAG TPA: Re/Si-specific NAD(P)(+) transhydrogenase subunit alpha [Planctomycetes bacterium]|nr:Re/Si-specific NAD(P)(+) transhydrogenase subunit alpha [Planctomycetota bacterium]